MTTLLEVQHLSKSFGGLRVTDDVSLTVTLAGPDAVVTVSGAKSATPAYAPPSPAAPPTRAAATMIPATLPAPSFARGDDPAGANAYCGGVGDVANGACA